MKRQTILFALIFLAVAMRPAHPVAESAQNPPVEAGKVAGAVTRAGTADPLPEAMITLQRIAGPLSPAGARRGGPRASAGARGTRAAMAKPSGIWSRIGIAIAEAAQ